jgi:tRNA(Ile)-lysidine synthase
LFPKRIFLLVAIQVAARELRYSWFQDVLNADSTDDWYGPDKRETKLFSKPKYILTAHHLDDNIETMLMHLFRGTGIGGLRGILPKQGKIVRPLLFARKEELLDFAKGEGLQWVEDSSNEEDKYRRNYFRNSLIPAIEKGYPGSIANLGSNLERFREIEILYHQAVDAHKKYLLEKKGSEIHIPVLKLMKSEPLRTICFEIIRDFGFSTLQTEDFISLIHATSGKQLFSSSHRILKHRKWIIISPIDSTSSKMIWIEHGATKVKFQDGLIQISSHPVAGYSLPNSDSTASLDGDQIGFPLILRKWKQGDYFYPLGMRKKKKIARFLIDKKISKIDKEKIWVIESNQKIIWVVGKRIDDRFKITKSTQSVLIIEMRMA